MRTSKHLAATDIESVPGTSQHSGSAHISATGAVKRDQGGGPAAKYHARRLRAHTATHTPHQVRSRHGENFEEPHGVVQRPMAELLKIATVRTVHGCPYGPEQLHFHFISRAGLYKMAFFPCVASSNIKTPSGMVAPLRFCQISPATTTSKRRGRLKLLGSSS